MLARDIPVKSHDISWTAVNVLCDCIADEDCPVEKQEEEKAASKNQQNISEKSHGRLDNHSINNSTPSTPYSLSF